MVFTGRCANGGYCQRSEMGEKKMEGSGEDTYLGTKIGLARIKGFRGRGLGSLDAVMACAKHFAAYGAAVGGRDYNSVDMSLQTIE